MSFAGIACVRPECLGRLQKKSQTFAGHRRRRQKNRPAGRDGIESRRTLRLLLVMHLHDRHGAHLILDEALKQAGQRAGKGSTWQVDGSISLQCLDNPDSTGLSSRFRKIFVTGRNAGFPVRVWWSCHWRLRRNAARTKPAPTVSGGACGPCVHPLTLWERACSRRGPDIHHITNAREKKRQPEGWRF